jgi:hypothetical protein
MFNFMDAKGCAWFGVQFESDALDASPSPHPPLDDTPLKDQGTMSNQNHPCCSWVRQLYDGASISTAETFVASRSFVLSPSVLP